MSPESENLTVYRARILTLIVLIIVAAPIVVANLSHAERPPLAWPPPNPSYGWPLTWYWCEFVASSPLPRSGVAERMNPELLEWSVPGLAANLAIWSLILSVAGVATEWCLRRYGSRLRFRPRVVTLITLIVAAAVIALANLSSEDVRWPGPGPAYGWPLIWRWRDVKIWYGASTELDQNYSTARLTGNLATWLVLLGAAGTACEWMLRRYEPRFRWSLRAMLAAVGLAAVFCAWAVALRERANLQDPLILAADSTPGQQNFYLYLERSGPKWLDLVGAGRFRRRIVGADLDYSDDEGDEQLFKGLGRLSTLRYLNLRVRRATSGMAAALGKMSQLQILRVEDVSYLVDNEVSSQECLRAIAKLTQLERLHLNGTADTGVLACLDGLTNLKSLSLQIDWDHDEQASDGPNIGISPLAHLPPLPRLEAVDLGSMLGGAMAGDHDLRHLAALPRLRSLNLSDSDVTADGLPELASLKCLEELAIGGDLATPSGLQSLVSLKHLKALHVQRYTAVTKETLAALLSQESLKERESAGGPMGTPEGNVLAALELLRELRVDEYGSYDVSDRLTTVALDHGDRIFALESEADGLRRAIDALRHANPGIVIDSDPKWFDQERGKLHQQSFFLAP